MAARAAAPAATLLSHIRAGYPSLSIVVLAMRDDPLIKARALAAGASAFLPKERIGDLLGHTLAAKAHEHDERGQRAGCHGR